jgi:SAM-dependent methyltransferase
VTLSTPAHQRIAAVAEAAVAIASHRHPSSLHRDITRLSALFTHARGQRRHTYMQDPALRRAYLAFFVPHNVARIALLLLRARDEGHLPDTAAPRVLDVGAGPLTGMLACWAVWGHLGPSRAVDLARSALLDGQAVLRAVGADVDAVDLVDRSLLGPPSSWLPQDDADVVVAANVINEVGDPRDIGPRLRLVQTLVRSLAPQGRLVVVEPAMRVEGRALLAVRDAIVEQNLATVLSPCRGAPRCPLLSTRGDWCHGDVTWQARPSSYRALETATGLAKASLAASHLLLAPASTPEPSAGLRLVGGLMRDAHGVERRYACGTSLVTLAGSPRLSPRVQQAARGELVRDDAQGHPTKPPLGPKTPATTRARPETPGTDGVKPPSTAHGQRLPPAPAAPSATTSGPRSMGPQSRDSQAPDARRRQSVGEAPAPPPPRRRRRGPGK